MWGIKVKGQGHWERKRKYRFSRTYSSKLDRFTSNQDRYDDRAILHIASNTFHQRKWIACRSGHPGRAGLSVRVPGCQKL